MWARHRHYLIYLFEHTRIGVQTNKEKMLYIDTNQVTGNCISSKLMCSIRTNDEGHVDNE